MIKAYRQQPASARRLQDSLIDDRQPSKQVLSPVANLKDVGRNLLRSFGTLDLEQVIPDPDQPRKHIDADDIERLAESIRVKGQLQPIRVRWSETENRWIIVAGERRYQATKKAGLSSIECHFVESELSDSEKLEVQLVENLLREDLNPLEEAHAYQQLMQLNNWSGKQLSEAICVQPSRVTRAVALLRLDPRLQSEIHQCRLSASAAYELSKIKDLDQRAAILDKLPDDSSQITIAQVKQELQHAPSKTNRHSNGHKLSFPAGNGWSISLTSRRKGNYHEVEQALTEALEEVRLRIDNRVALL